MEESDYFPQMAKINCTRINNHYRGRDSNSSKALRQWSGMVMGVGGHIVWEG